MEPSPWVCTSQSSPASGQCLNGAGHVQQARVRVDGRGEVEGGVGRRGNRGSGRMVITPGETTAVRDTSDGERTVPVALLCRLAWVYPASDCYHFVASSTETCGTGQDRHGSSGGRKTLLINDLRCNYWITKDLRDRPVAILPSAPAGAFEPTSGRTGTGRPTLPACRGRSRSASASLPPQRDWRNAPAAASCRLRPCSPAGASPGRRRAGRSA